LQNSAEQINNNRMTSIPRYVFAYYDLDLECPIDFTYIKENKN